MTARTARVQGTGSSVGKSLLVAALCRSYARRGLRVAPFKAQNMALNAAVTPDGAEIGRAQLAQAVAARAVPCADMNPILLKPESTSRSQVVLLGRAVGSFSFGEYHRKKPELRAVVGDALDRLRAAHDLVVIEGAGSPAEVNLRDRDLVNMWVAARAEAPVLLVTDIERGGALAAVVGTLELLEPGDRARVQGVVVNKFRGDPALFADGVRFLERRCGIPVLGVVPHLGDPGVPSEDSLDLRAGGGGGPSVAAVRLPRLSNFDELEPLAREPGVALRWVERPEELSGAALVVLPGTKRTVDDLAWLRATGLAGAIRRHAAGGGAVLGICGGYQMLGERILDPEGVESSAAAVNGLGLLPVTTRFQREKITAPVRLRLGEGLPLLESAGGLEVSGYEIHAGRVELGEGALPFGTVLERAGAPCREAEGAIASETRVAGTLVHGLLEDGAVRSHLLRGLGVAASPPGRDPYDALADAVEGALDLPRLDAVVALPG